MPETKPGTTNRRPAQNRADLRAWIEDTVAVRRQVIEADLTLRWPQPLLDRVRLRLVPEDARAVE